MHGRKKRALVLAGAGAALQFGAPDTTDLTNAIENRVRADDWMRHTGADRAYLEILAFLAGYLQGGAPAVNFEHLYHCAHQLLFTFKPTDGAVNEYRPILVPFIKRRFGSDEGALRALVGHMAKFIFAELSSVCEKPETSLDPLANFLARLREDHVTRIYTTNYDDFLLQAAPDLHTGFPVPPSPDPKRFDPQAFWEATDTDGVFHLHGSVHLGYPRPPPPGSDLGTLYWFDDRATALNLADSPYVGSGKRKMDGSEVIPTAVITGLDKLSCMQQQPFSHYYASMARDAMAADIIYVIGSGLADLHLNTWLSDARRRNPVPPLIFVDYWRDGFLQTTAAELDRKTIEMFHALRLHVHIDDGGTPYGDGWTLDRKRTCAIWEKGFLAFLNASGRLERVLEELERAPS